VTAADPSPVGHPPRRLYLDLGAGCDERWLTGWLRLVLPTLDWRARLFLVGDGGPGQWSQAERLLPAVTDHLDEHPLTKLSLHPVVGIANHADVDTLTSWRLLDAARRFQAEAYREQSEARLAVHPVFVPVPGTLPDVVRSALRLAHTELATPCLLLASDPPAGWLEIPEVAETRLYLRTDAGGGSSGTLATLGAHHVVESVLEGIRAGSTELLLPCRRHLVVDAARRRVFPCLGAWRRGDPWRTVSDGEGRLDTPDPDVPVAECPACIQSSVVAALPALDLAGRRSEARQVCFLLGLALSREGDHHGAAGLAERAAELSGSDADRAAALLHHGLSLLEIGRLAEADQALLGAARAGADPGLVAYHRGRVQMAWPDEIEALERFEEAAASPSPYVNGRDLHLEMALAHIRLEEHADARPHLDAAGAPDNRSAISFLRGVCDLNQGAADAALEQFEAALEQQPEPDDLARVLLYLATTLKELERFADALPRLDRAIELEPDELAHRNLQGFCYYRLGRHAEAVECFRRAVEIDPSSALDWANLGSNLRDLGRVDEAIAAYRRALELDPTIGFAAENLARLLRAETRDSGISNDPAPRD
jgi:tetratricopeptide (TPR) repeat protein